MATTFNKTNKQKQQSENIRNKMDLTDQKACLVLVHGFALQLEFGLLLSFDSQNSQCFVFGIVVKSL